MYFEMSKIKYQVAFIFGVCIICQGMSFDISKFKRDDLKNKQNCEVKVLNADFEQGLKSWRINKFGTAAPRMGRNGTTALEYKRTNPGSYKLVSQVFNLKPNRFYRFGAWIKTQNVKAAKGGGAALCLEFSGTDKNGKRKYMSGYFHSGLSGTKDWTLVSAVKRVPKRADRATLTLYMWKGATGTAWYDDVFLVEQGNNLWTAYQLSPFNAPLDKQCRIKLFYDNGPVMKMAQAGALYGQLEFKKLNKKFTVKIEDNEAVFNLESLPAGSYQSKFYCLDIAKKKVLYSKGMPVILSKDPLERKVAIDGRGRTFVRGKAFLPIGVFTAGLSRKDVDVLSSAGVNCALPYSSMHLSFKRKQNSVGNLKEVLDYCEKKKLKVIFSAKDVGSKMRYAIKEWHGAKGQNAIIRKLVSTLKDHPAILAWYINDEQAISEIPRLTKMRQLYNRLDPDHPTFGLDYKFESLPMCGPTSDIFGIDVYPIGKKPPFSLKKNEYAMQQLNKLGTAKWVVPQMMNMGAFYAKDQKDCAKKFRSPTEAEMRSMVLLEALYGAKGFIFYHYNYLKSWKLPKDNFKKEWPVFCNVVKTLKYLEPYILSDHDIVKLKVKNLQGQTRACKMIDNEGKEVILLVAIGPGKTKAEVNLTGNYKSKFGNTRKKNDKYVFETKGINSDILY